ncbi:MAG: NADH-quinone oxidoreductase subunit F, partial [Balneolaceae bacterium]
MAVDWISYKPKLIPDIPDLHNIGVYIKNGGYEALKKVLSDDWTPKTVVDEVKEANIRGRGGAGFNAGLKWSFMPDPDGGPRYLACNGDESEPGTFKDRKIFEYNPHLFIEGALIAAYAMQCTTIYVYIRGEYLSWIHMMEKALSDAYDKGFIGENILGSDFSVNFYTYTGAGAYI